jgi:signal transduction histidine kinase
MLIEPEPEPTPDAAQARASSIHFVGNKRKLKTSPSRARSTELEFLQLALHDLQTPVAILDTSMKLLIGDFASADSETLLTLRDAQRAARRIQQYIDHLLTAERFGRGLGVDRNPFDLSRMLADFADEYRGAALVSDATLDLDVDLSMIVEGDVTLIRRVLQNLLENALRHVPSGGRILVEARFQEAFEIRICNDGPPVRLDSRERIFDKFCGDRRQTGTTGIGLYFCRLAVEAHGGTIAVEDYPEWPTCFVVRLPA